MAERKAPRGYVTLREAAEITGCNIEMIRGAAQRGELKGNQRVPLAPWCFKPEDLYTWRGIEEPASAAS